MRHEEQVKFASELLVANMTLEFQHGEKVKREQELLLANEELLFQSEEKAKQAAELFLANEALFFEREEKCKRAAELLAANNELLFQNVEKGKRATELLIAGEQLNSLNTEKAKRAAELVLLNKELTRAEKHQDEYQRGLEQMMFLISHRVRQPLVNISGLADMLLATSDTAYDNTRTISYLKQSALALDVFTKELSAFIERLKQTTASGMRITEE
jgi:signal transduction histidine kinase